MVASDPLPVTGLLDEPTESPHAVPPERLDGSLSPSALLENSRHELRFWAGMLWRWSVLTIRMQLVHVEMIESFRSAVISEVASSLASLQVTEEGGLGERPPANTTGSLGEDCVSPSS